MPEEIKRERPTNEQVFNLIKKFCDYNKKEDSEETLCEYPCNDNNIRICEISNCIRMGD